jgi:dTDP-4-dehydrorhamnose reductase
MVMDKKRLLASGLSGMVGSRFAQLYGDRYEFEHLDLSRGVDITNPEAVEAVIGSTKAEVMLHLAAFTNVSAAHEQLNNPGGACYQVNVVGTLNVAQACRKHGKHLIHISTDFVFDGDKQEPYTEADEPHPIEWYGQTKLWAEEKVQEIMDEERWVILRLAYPYQARPVRPDFLANMITNMKADTLPPQFADHVITPTFTDDIAGVFDTCIQKKPTGIYHCVGSSSHSDYELALLVKEVFGLKGEVKKGLLEDYLKQVKRPYQKTMRVSNAKIQREFGIHMNSLNEGLRIIKSKIVL